MPNDFIAGFCEGWDVPAHDAEHDELIHTVKHPKGYYQLCDACYEQYQKDHPVSRPPVKCSGWNCQPHEVERVVRVGYFSFCKNCYKIYAKDMQGRG